MSIALQRRIKDLEITVLDALERIRTLELKVATLAYVDANPEVGKRKPGRPPKQPEAVIG